MAKLLLITMVEKYELEYLLLEFLLNFYNNKFKLNNLKLINYN